MNVELWMAKSKVLENSNGPLSEVQGYIIDSCLARGDFDKAHQLIKDWNSRSTRPVNYVSKWIPGNHFYALNAKFDAIEDAISHLEAAGYRYGGLRERFQYRENGG